MDPRDPADDAVDADEDASLAGGVMSEAIRQWCRAINDDAPTLVSRFLIIAECHDGEGKWIQRGAYDVDGADLPAWEALGLLDYARVREQALVNESFDEMEDDTDA